MSAIDYFMGHLGLMLLFKMELRIMNNEEKLQELVKKLLMILLLWMKMNLTRRQKRIHVQSKELDFIMYTRLDEILGWPHRRLVEAKKEGEITAKEKVLLNNLD